MDAAKYYEIALLILLIGCAVSVNLTKSLLQAVIIFMAYSSIMCVLWILMESPDLAITEASVGAGVSGMLFLMTLRKLRQLDQVKESLSGGAPGGTPPGGADEAVFGGADGTASDKPGKDSSLRNAAGPEGEAAGAAGPEKEVGA